jgi:shikimate dehydrogenase
VRKFGLIGYPLGHSFSKKYFSEKFVREGIQGCQFELYPIESISEFPQLMDRESSLEGLSVTIPYKEQVIPYLDALDPASAQIGAVNCIRIRAGRKTGFNTDYLGFKHSLQSWLGTEIPNALVLGTGGASKAVQHSLREFGTSYRIVSRNQMEGQLTYDDLRDQPEWLASHPLIINTTPLGTFPQVEDLPNIPLEQLHAAHRVYDLVYNPPITRLMQECIARGGTAKNGQDMLELQAEAAWSIWNSPS